MNRIGWTVLVAILLVAGLFATLLSFGGPVPPASKSVPEPPPVPSVRSDGLPSLSVPVSGVSPRQITDTWGQARSEGRQHHGTDIIAPGGSPVIAAAAGTVERLFQSGRGGTTLYERSTDRRWTFYYAHLLAYAPGMTEGKIVHAGDLIGYVGDTGDAGPGNYHLHFGLTRTTPKQHWYEGEDVNAYPSLAGTPLPR